MLADRDHLSPAMENTTFPFDNPPQKVDEGIPSSVPSSELLSGSGSGIIKIHDSIGNSVRSFLQLHQHGVPDDAGVVFDNLSAVGSGTGVSTAASNPNSTQL